MAIDAYLQIEGIKGESADERHKDWIEVSNVTGSVHQPRAATKVILENVMISGVTFNSGDGGTVKEMVHLAYSKIKWEYIKQSIRGGAQGSTLGGWDCAANKCV